MNDYRTERAETNSRPRMTAADQRNYSGIAQHPLGRRWLLRRIHEAERAATEARAAGDATAEERHRLELRRVHGECRRLGIDLEGRSGA